MAELAPPNIPRNFIPPVLLRAKALDVNRLDHQTGFQNGSTSALEISPQRIQLAKQNRSPNLTTRVEELTKDLGYLRYEIQFYRQGFGNLQRLRETCCGIYLQLSLALHLDHSSDRLHELVVQLHNV